MNQSTPPFKPTPPEQSKPAAMPAAPQPVQQPATNQPKPTTDQPTDRAGEKTKTTP